MSRMEQLQRLLAADDADADLHYMIAQEHSGAGETERAISHYDRCLALDPGYLYAHYHKARALEGAGRVDEAIVTLRVGLAAAKERRDTKASGEMRSYLESLEG